MDAPNFIRSLMLYNGFAQRDAAEEMLKKLTLGDACEAFSACQGSLAIERNELKRFMDALEISITRVGKLKVIEQKLRAATIRALGDDAAPITEPVEVPGERVLRRAMDLKEAGEL